MKLSKYITGSAVGLLALGMASCGDYLEDTPHYGNMNSEDVCKTTTSARQAVQGACQGMSGIWSYDLLYQFLGAGDNAISTFYGEMPGTDSYNNFFLDVNPSWDLFYTMNDSMGKGNYVWDAKTWMWAYAMIGQLNEVLDGIDGAEGDATERNFTKGEALTLRAHLYWRLLQCYAPRWEASDNGETLSVVLRLSAKDPQEMPLAKMNEVLDQLYGDLDTAIECFKNAGNVSRDLTYEPDLPVCYGVYARVAALKNDWTKVKEMAHNARQGKRSSTPAQMAKGYAEYESGEWMWSGSFNSIDNFVYSNWSTSWAANGYRACNASGTNKINIDLYRKIPATDERRNLWFTFDKTDVDPADVYDADNFNLMNLDPSPRSMRRAASAWILEHTPAGFTDAYVLQNNPDGAGDNEATRPVLCDGAQMKFFCHGMLGQSGWSFPPYMRATEMYLLEAEACAMLGQTGEAQAILNEVNGKYDPAYSCTKSGQELIDEVRTYTRIELWGEGFCWFNLKRWGMNLTRRAWIAGDPTSGNMPGAIACDVAPDAANLWRYGIPRSETNYNNAVSYPYPGNGM